MSASIARVLANPLANGAAMWSEDTKTPEPTVVDLGFCWWPGAGSNRRPSDFQSDARTN